MVMKQMGPGWFDSGRLKVIDINCFGNLYEKKCMGSGTMALKMAATEEAHNVT